MAITTVKAMPGFTFGCDPELFVADPTGRLVSAEGLIPGTKENPHKVAFGAVQVDGMAAEFNIDPVQTYFEWEGSIVKVMTQLQSMLPRGFSLVQKPAVVFDEEQWERSPDNAKELGCSPDYNAWTEGVNPPPQCLDNPRLRTASGHIHIGWTTDESLADPDHAKNCRDLVKQLDWYLGSWSLNFDKDNTRRDLYGKAGAMRYKDYGVEYRVLSNFWLQSAKHRQSVWNRMNAAIKAMRKDYLPESAANFNNRLIESINTSTLDASLSAQYMFPIHTLTV